MAQITRRSFVGRVAAGAALTGAAIAGRGAHHTSKRRMTISLYPGSIGVRADQRGAIRLAAKHGFESVEAMSGALAALSDDAFAALAGEMADLGVVFGGAGLPVDFRRDQDRFQADLAKLPAAAAALQRAGVTRISTWIMPSHASLTYMANMKLHAQRLRQVARVAADHGLRFGLEYVGTQSLLVGRKYPFVHTFAECRDLIEAIGADNVGFVLDSWHWFTAGDSVEDILTLTNDDIALVDLNDAPWNTPKAELRDNRRELPMATGRIDAGAFLAAIHKVGYDGPVRAEPFNQALNEMDNDAACAATAAAMKKAFSVIS